MKHQPSILRGAFLLFFVSLFVGCASYQDDLAKVKQFYYQKSYPASLEALEKSSVKTSSRSRLLYLLEKSQILDKMGERKKSRALLLQADKLVDELYTVSVSKEAATYLLNESAQDYPGEDYEKVAIHTMLALSFLKEGEIASARVEARRINTRLNEINGGYDEKSKNRYKEDAFARYLAGMIYESRREFDSAIIDYRKAMKLYEGDYSRLFKTSVPRSLVTSLYRLYLQRGRRDEARQLKKNYARLLAVRPESKEKFGELIVIHQVGQIASKTRHEHVIPFGRQIVRLSFPIIRPKSSYAFGKTGVQVEGTKFIASEQLQNMDYIAAKTLEDRRLRLVLKAGARLILKGQMAQQARKEGGPLAELAVNIFGAVTETADTRQWTFLPSQFKVSRVPLRPGNHKVKIFNDGKLDEISSVKVRAGEMKFLVL